jgi:virulence-associated protein VagC
MSTATTLFESGGCLAVRIPKRLGFSSRRVSIRREGESLIISPIEPQINWGQWAENSPKVSDDFMDDRPVSSSIERDW